MGIGLIGCGGQPDSPAIKGDAAGAQPSPTTVRQEDRDQALAAAEEYLGRGEYASAEVILAELIEQAPRTYRAHELYGQVLYLKGVYAAQAGDLPSASGLLPQAYDHYRIAVELAETLDPLAAAGLHQSAGEIASAAQLNDAALTHFQEAGRLDPTSPKHPLYEAQIMLQQGRWTEARHALERVLALDPDEAFAHASLATVAQKENDRAKAIEHIEEARRIEPQNLALRVQETKIRRLCGQPRRGLELLVTLDEQQRAEEAVTYEIAECYRALGEPSKAALAWEHRYGRHPAAWRSAVRAGEARLEAGQREQAWVWYEQAGLAAPETPQVKSLQEALTRDADDSE